MAPYTLRRAVPYDGLGRVLINPPSALSPQKRTGDLHRSLPARCFPATSRIGSGSIPSSTIRCMSVIASSWRCSSHSRWSNATETVAERHVCYCGALLVRWPFAPMVSRRAPGPRPVDPKRPSRFPGPDDDPRGAAGPIRGTTRRALRRRLVATAIHWAVDHPLWNRHRELPGSTVYVARGPRLASAADAVLSQNKIQE
jgi:hypothetical protein